MDLRQDRRTFMRTVLAGGGAASALMPSIARALSIAPHRRTGTIRDVEHVVILTQENRAFDHYFGAMNGVRGFGDRFAIPAPPLPQAPDRTVFVQPAEPGKPGPALLTPFRLDTQKDFRLVRPLGTPHSFPDSQAAWDNGRLGAWPHHKHNHAMAYFTREDIPFQYALAEAFTLCDAYHCAMHLSTNPNRLYIWTGTHDPLGKGNGPAIDNGYDGFADPLGHGGYSWTTYPERLLEAGISFQIYEDMADNFSDNPLVGFKVYRAARDAAGGPLAELARRTLGTRTLTNLKQDVMTGTLPQVSWIVAPTAYSEHPSVSTPLQGAEYTARVLDALTANPDVWARTVLFLNFDENDGLFDHAPPPAPPARDPNDPARSIGGTTVPAEDEYHVRSQDEKDAPYLNRPYGLGPRVPMYVVSPWSTGGYVASEVFDHTSVIRFLETRFGVHEPNISAWRRAVCGDLTSCFDFDRSDSSAFLAKLPETRPLSDRAAGLQGFDPPLPATLTNPAQEPGPRRRRPTPYLLDVALEAGGTPRLLFRNTGRERAAVFHVYALDRLTDVPARYTVGAGQSLAAPLAGTTGGDLFILGPNGFHRRLAGRPNRFGAGLEQGQAHMATLHLANATDGRISLSVDDMAYGQAARSVTLEPRGTASLTFDFAASHGWYDLHVRGDGQSWRLAGHVEDGAESLSDPATLTVAPLRLQEI
ncbi:phosphocholine-specific phospholipase C [Oleisolibacter albus]|uniref:phosphocholine-specific phospholipase C n=1 Tax=Oleisolibacter albus TaxID=2171757 RepID=UPI000DF2457B|nr:phospholipase C, phosphocholine-specific [Oleisolibacter albus]